MQIKTFKTLDSTNKYAKENIDKLVDKTVITTSIQTNGYGRFDRKWVDLGDQNIYMTFVLKPSDEIKEVYANLTQYLSVCLCHQLELMGVYPQIKWPNDVLINGKKVCGILAESVIRGGKLKGIVLGIGINLNASKKCVLNIDRPATSLNLELKRDIDKNEFLQNLVTKFYENYDEFLKYGFSSIKAEYSKRASFLNMNLKVAVFNQIKEGFAKDLDDYGNLVLVMPDGTITKLNMGEIM